MARFYPSDWDSLSPRSESLVRTALESLADDWSVFSHLRWLNPKAEVADGETDFVLLHPVHAILVLEVKGGSFEVRDGAWWIVDREGRLRPLGRNGPYAQATRAKYELRRRLRGSCPHLASRLGHLVCFASGEPEGDLGADAPPQITLSNKDLSHIHDRVVGAARFLGISDDAAPIPADEVVKATALLAPSGRIKLDSAARVARVRTQLDELTEARIRLTRKQLSALQSMRSRRALVVYGPAGTGKTTLAVRRGQELLAEGANVLVLCTSAQLVGYYREILAGEWSGRLTVGRISVLLEPDNDVLAADSLIVDEAQNLRDAHLRAIPHVLRKPDSKIDLMCDLEQLRDDERRDAWKVPFDHDTHFLVENLRNSPEIVAALRTLGYEGIEALGARSGIDVEVIECQDGSEMRAACVQVVYDLVTEERLKEGQIGVIAEAAHEVATLCASLGIATSTNTWAFGRAARSRLDVGGFETFQGLERDVVVVLEPTAPTSPPALDRPSGSSSVPAGDLAGLRSNPDLRAVLRIALSRARGRAIVIGGSNLREALELRPSDRYIRARAAGHGDRIEIHGVRPGDPAAARAARRPSVAPSSQD